MPSARRRPYTARLPPEQRREQLLDAALAIIARDGYAGVSIDAIAKEAGVTRPVVYGVYAGLPPLLYALLHRQEERVLAQLLAALPTDWGGELPGSELLAAIRRLIEAVRRDPMTWRPVLLAGEGTPAVVTERIERDRELLRARVQSLLEYAVRRGQIARLDAELVSHAVIGASEYMGRRICLDPDWVDVDRLVNAIGDILSRLRR